MNKYIKTDIEQGLQYLKIGIMNAFSEIESGNTNSIELGNFIPFSLIRKCAEERGYQETEDFDTNGWDLDSDYWYYIEKPNQKICIEGNFYYGTFEIFKIEDDE